MSDDALIGYGQTYSNLKELKLILEVLFLVKKLRVNFGSSDHALVSRRRDVGKVKQPK